MSGEDTQDEDGAPSLEAPSLKAPSLFKRRSQRAPTPEPTPEATPEPAPAPAPAPPPVAAPRPAPVRKPKPGREPEPVVEQPVVEQPVVEQPVAEEPTVVQPVAAEPVAPEPVPAESAAPREPWLTGRPAAAVTGLLVGALVVAATAGSQRGCSAVRGTSSCGGAGFFLLVAILVVAVLVGGALLRAAEVPEPGSTAFLAVGLISVVTLLFLVGQLFQWWMALVIPVVAIAMFVLSHWVTTSFIEPAEG